MNIYENIDDGKYNTNLHYVSHKYNPQKNEAWAADCIRLHNLFKADAIEAAGLTGHPKAEHAFDIAWAHEHGSGLADVFGLLDEMADLLK